MIVNATRYTFDGVGIFHAIDLLLECDMERNDREDLDWACNKFENELIVPDASVVEGTRSYFTEQGLDHFSEPLVVFVSLFQKYLEEAGIGELSVEHRNVPDDKIAYSDNFQILTKNNS
jgi:hypothetical protein